MVEIVRADAKKTEWLQVVVSHLADEEYGLPIKHIQEIIRLPEITHMPGLPGFVEGIINLRGKIIPIIDLRKKFVLPLKPKNDKNRIIIVEIMSVEGTHEKQNIGLVVDGVTEVIRLSKDQIDEIPPSIAQINAAFLSGVGKLEKRIIILLDINSVINEIEKSLLKDMETKPA